jgi:nucleotide-binding universal stress UspA family protein
MSEIIVGYDGTECAHAALDAACSLAASTGDDVVLAYGYMPSQTGGDVPPLRDALRELGAQVTDEGVAQAREAGVQATVELVAERPAQGLADLAKERQARMIVVGSYGESPLKGALLGSTPHKLLAITDIPVLVVRAR